jgi:hypothetical protein
MVSDESYALLPWRALFEMITHLRLSSIISRKIFEVAAKNIIRTRRLAIHSRLYKSFYVGRVFSGIIHSYLVRRLNKLLKLWIIYFVKGHSSVASRTILEHLSYKKHWAGCWSTFSAPSSSSLLSSDLGDFPAFEPS